jgi:hypothetical protein
VKDFIIFTKLLNKLCVMDGACAPAASAEDIALKWQHTKQTPAEQFRHTHPYVTLRQRLRTLLRTLRLQRLQRIICLLLRRARVRKRQS